MEWKDRVLKTLNPLQQVCHNCTMCSLGRKFLDSKISPQVFSNMNPSKWFVVGQNPGMNEREQKEPFVGDAGKFFDTTIEQFGLNRQQFYISNAVKCWTENNASPDATAEERCRPFLQMELNLIRPKLVITLGSVAFKAFCPNQKLSDHLGSIIECAKYDVKIYPIYHPSPRNMSIANRREKFVADIKKLCLLIKSVEKS